MPDTLDIPTLLAELTLAEKASLLDGDDFWHTQGIERLGIPSVMLTDGPHGLRKQDTGGDHLGLEASVPATCFPPAAGIASSWDPDLLARVGEALGVECRAEHVAVLLGPGVNMKRSPLCGRNFEYFSEDPLLSGALGAGWINGVQSQGVGTSLKHFAANNQETQRMTISSEVDERTLREIYLPAFEIAVQRSQPWTVMCAYNKVNGVFASEDPWLLTDVLRSEWGFDGIVVSDWGAVNDRPVGVAAGLDLEMPAHENSAAKILAAVEAGTLSVEDIDLAVSRMLTLLNRATPGLATGGSFDAAAHHELAREAARASAVLLKNDGGLLPLAAEGGRVAVIGEFARTPRYQGAGSSQVNPTQLDNALDALQSALGSREVSFAAGYVTDSEVADPALTTEAVAAAAGAEVVLLFLGLPAHYESEGYDREHMNLPQQQLDLLDAVADANPNVVVVLSNGSVVATAGWQDRVPAILETWLLGQAGGSATADLLTGAANPSGKLAETIPVRLVDNPTIGNFPGEAGEVRYGEGLLIGYRWYDERELEVAFPFGFGLSYTSFELSDLAVEVSDNSATVRLNVTNTGAVAGTETVQVYVGDPEASVFRPKQELRGFARVSLEPGASAPVEIALDSRAFAYWHTTLDRFVVEGGEFEIRVGVSSRDIRLVETISLPGEEIRVPLQPMSPVETWLADPEAGPWLRPILDSTPLGRLMFHPVNGPMMRAIPMQRLARFPGFSLTEADVDDAVAHYAS